MEKEICKIVAKIYADKDWHKLSSDEVKLVDSLKKAGYIKATASGFVGKDIQQ